MTTRRHTLTWTSTARRDLLEIGDIIARDKPAAARRWVRALLEAAERAANFPMAGRVVPELDREDVREVLYGRYRIVYRVDPGEVLVLTVFDGHRLFPVGAVGPAVNPSPSRSSDDDD